MTKINLISALLAVSAGLLAQSQDDNAARMAAGSTPMYRVNVTARTAKAVNYRHRSGATKIDFKGTDLLAGARGEAKVESKQGYIEIEVEFDDLQPANKLGSEYLTYVLWAITPEGRTANLGEILLNGTKSKLNVTTDFQVFALVVTAEPYYSVTRPSDLIVMENVVRADTKGKIEEVDAKYELLQRGQYQRLSNPLALKLDQKTPLELYEARNAVQIARGMGADRFATETFQKAEKSLAQAEAYETRNAGRKPVAMMSREAVQMAEDSRAIAVKRQEDEALATERRQSVDREALAQSDRVAAQTEADRVTREAQAARIQAQADSERLTREKDAQAAAAAAEADRVKRENDARIAAATTEADRLKAESQAKDAAANLAADHLRAENDARVLAANAETDRLKAESQAKDAAANLAADRLKAENDARMLDARAEADRLKEESKARDAAANLAAGRLKAENDSRIAASAAEADRLRQDNETQRAATQAALERAAKDKLQSETEKAELRSQLLKQFNDVLQTRDTARGLIVNMSDVLFDTGRYTLRPLAREKLAKVAGIVSGHPGLKLDVEGHTDSVGGDDYNQRLSEQRGDAVRDYLTQAGMPAASVTAKGLGKTQPVASNDTPQGRQQNRRVELVISGDVIGTQIGAAIGAR
ncbi:MAG TPA: OmpA family protein [Candidatus Limnocylindrales bacterium]|nr:OmpA family protein [Candidatus Limnocylindrales bacterium]